ncbi:extracellular solute-binding protein [Homoserinimonas sp. OAct 916]|uniref:extracellular solute-binding protein n=1 Tax=Homoserinimonas sp. OAct 916 TaxID=2211450 RepID=UPI0013001BA8|nr:extracellular solute-binding protein [Homoserinimonas sp. OAct 916]
MVHLPRSLHLIGGLAAAALLATALTACSAGTTAEPGAETGQSPSGAATPATLTIYSGQHEAFAQSLADAFTADTGIATQLRAGSDVELVNQIIEEGDNSKADVILTEEPGPIDTLAAAGVLSPVSPPTLAKTVTQYNPGNGLWLAWAARARSVVYNPTMISADKLPAHLLDLADPKWKGTFAYAPSGAFVGTVTYLIDTIGADKTRTWLEGIRDNGENLGKNAAVRDAVEAGQISFGLINHYYWFLKADEVGAENMVSKQHYMGNQDAGALVFPSGAGVLKTSSHQAEAQQFLGWLADADGGQKIVASDSPQYPLGIGVTSTQDLEPLENLDPPVVDSGDFANPENAQQLLVEVGII